MEFFLVERATGPSCWATCPAEPAGESPRRNGLVASSTLHELRSGVEHGLRGVSHCRLLRLRRALRPMKFVVNEFTHVLFFGAW